MKKNKDITKANSIKPSQTYDQGSNQLPCLNNERTDSMIVFSPNMETKNDKSIEKSFLKENVNKDSIFKQNFSKRNRKNYANSHRKNFSLDKNINEEKTQRNDNENYKSMLLLTQCNTLPDLTVKNQAQQKPNEEKSEISTFSKENQISIPQLNLDVKNGIRMINQVRKIVAERKRGFRPKNSQKKPPKPQKIEKSPKNHSLNLPGLKLPISSKLAHRQKNLEEFKALSQRLLDVRKLNLEQKYHFLKKPKNEISIDFEESTPRSMYYSELQWRILADGSIIMIENLRLIFFEML